MDDFIFPLCGENDFYVGNERMWIRLVVAWIIYKWGY